MKNPVKDYLKARVVAYIKNEICFNPNSEVSVMGNESCKYFILYGKDLFDGVTGLGTTASKAYKHFLKNWNFYSRKMELQNS